MLRPAEDRDLDAIREWRNQDANRGVSINRHIISPEEHQAWWQRVQADPSRRCLVFEYDGRPLGVVNFFDLDREDGSGSWGFFLDHETTTSEGTAMMAWMQIMREATDYAFEEDPAGLGLQELRAEVRPENEAVRMMNRRFRFTEGEPYETEGEAGTVITIPIRLRREDRRTRKARA
jgi:RimJ/RimL family protein N-acetyltransferase